MTKERVLQVRLSQPEKESLDQAAEIAGISLSAWVRERLRSASRTELQASGVGVPFLMEKGKQRDN